MTNVISQMLMLLFMKVIHAQSLRQGYAHMLSTDVDFKDFWSLLLQHRQLLRMSCFLLFWPSNMYNIVYHALHHNILIGHQDRLNFWVQTLTQMSDSFISFLLLIYLWYLYIFQNNNFCILINVYRHISFSNNHSNINS